MASSSRAVLILSAQVDLGSVDVAKFDDSHFKATEKKEKKKGEKEFFQVRGLAFLGLWTFKAGRALGPCARGNGGCGHCSQRCDLRR